MNEQPNKLQFTLDIRDLDTEVLPNAPDGWLQTKLTYKTDTFYKAVKRSLTLPLKFVLKGASLLRQEFYTYGILAKVVVTIGLLDPVKWDYNTMYSGKLDFSKAVDAQSSFTTDAISNDFTVQLDAYDTTKFTFPLTGPDILDLTLPPIRLQEHCDFIFNTSPDFRSSAFFQISVVNYQQFANLSSVSSTGFLANITPVFDKSTGNYFFIARTDGKVRVYGNINSSVNSGHYQFNIYKSDNTLVKILKDVTLSITTEVSFTWDFLVDVAEDDRLFFFIKNIGSVNTFIGVNMQNGVLSLDYNTSTPATKAKGIRAYDLYQRLLLAMNTTSPTEPNQPVPNQSFLLNQALGGAFGRLIYTCSDSIRAFFVDPFGNSVSTIVGALYQPGDNLQANGTYVVLGQNDTGSSAGVTIQYDGKTYNVGDTFTWVLGFDTFTSPGGFGFVRQTKSIPAIIISFKDFIQDIIALQGGQLGFAIQQGVAVLEDLSYFRRAGTGKLDLGILDTTTKITPAVDMQYNTIRGGYKDQQYDSTNGQSEVNSEVVYATDVLNPVAELNIQAISRADPYGIEITRVTPVDTSSSRSDNDNFMIMLKSAPEMDGSYKPLQMNGAMSFSGVDSSYYNWEITPKKNLLRGSRYLRSIFDKMDGYQITVSAPLKSTALITTDSKGIRVYEAQAETISAAFGAKIFLPYYLNCSAKLPVNASDLLDQTINSDIFATWNGVRYFGFPMDINVDEGENSAQNFKLLLTPNNNTLDSIR